MIERSKLINRAARELWVDMESKLSDITKNFTCTMEVNHFLSEFSLYAAIQINCEIGARNIPSNPDVKILSQEGATE